MRVRSESASALGDERSFTMKAGREDKAYFTASVFLPPFSKMNI